MLDNINPLILEDLVASGVNGFQAECFVGLPAGSKQPFLTLQARVSKVRWLSWLKHMKYEIQTVSY